MCKVSDKIKFCTCVSGSYDELPHYWLLYRFNKQKNLQCIGEPVFAQHLLHPHFQLNYSTLVTRLNEVDAFDTALDFKPKDQLEIVFNNLLDFTKRMVFCFRFKKGRWIPEEYDPFELMNHYDECRYGDFDELNME